MPILSASLRSFLDSCKKLVHRSQVPLHCFHGLRDLAQQVSQPSEEVVPIPNQSPPSGQQVSTTWHGQAQKQNQVGATFLCKGTVLFLYAGRTSLPEGQGDSSAQEEAAVPRQQKPLCNEHAPHVKHQKIMRGIALRKIC